MSWGLIWGPSGRSPKNTLKKRPLSPIDWRRETFSAPVAAQNVYRLPTAVGATQRLGADLGAVEAHRAGVLLRTRG